MDEVFDQVEKLGKAERRVAMVTLVATRGTSPKKEGAKMWVSEQGRILGSVTIGGCVDAQVIEESEKALASFESRLLSVTLGEEDAWEGGFTCAGTIQVMIEPLDLCDPEDLLISLYRLIHDEVKNGRRVVVATRLDNTSSKLVIFEDGRVSGAFGEAALDREARETALKLAVPGVVTLDTASSPTEVFFEIAFYSFPDVAHCGVNNPYKIKCFSNALRLARLCSGANRSMCGSAACIPRTSG